jgi:hypothetical protein
MDRLDTYATKEPKNQAIWNYHGKKKSKIIKYNFLQVYEIK